MNPFPTALLGSLTAAVLAACVACSSSGSAATAVDPGTRPKHRSAASRTAGVPSSPSTAYRRRFCALARTTGLAGIAVTGSGAHTDTATLLRRIDGLDAAAPAEIKTDFHTFDKIEHAVLRPGGAAPPQPGADVATAMAHVRKYLSYSCGLG